MSYMQKYSRAEEKKKEAERKKKKELEKRMREKAARKKKKKKHHQKNEAHEIEKRESSEQKKMEAAQKKRELADKKKMEAERKKMEAQKKKKKGDSSHSQEKREADLKKKEAAERKKREAEKKKKEAIQNKKKREMAKRKIEEARKKKEEASKKKKKQNSVDISSNEKNPLLAYLEKLGMASHFDKMNSGGVKVEDIELFLEEPDTLEEFIPSKFNRAKFIRAVKLDKERSEEGTGKDVISGEYNWRGRSFQIKDNFAYFKGGRYEFEKLTSNVYKIIIEGDLFVFIWDDEDEMLRVVRTKGEYEFIKRDISTNSDQICGEYDWAGRSLDIKKNFCYFERKRYPFQKAASTVYTVQMDRGKFVFNWDREDTVLGVVRVEGDGFFERVVNKKFVQK